MTDLKYALGVGEYYLEGYLNVDYPQEHHNVNDNIKADLYADILTMDYEPCIEIRSHHFFEHFNYFNTFILLYKWINALELNGILTIDIPDLEELCKAYLYGDIKTKFLVTRYLYGSHEAHWAYHINGWSKDTLEYILNDLGLELINIKKYGNFEDIQPNCGMTLTFEVKNKLNKQEISEKLINFLSLYKNGETDFENRLYKYFEQEFNKGK